MSYLVKSQVAANVSACKVVCGSATCQGNCPGASTCGINA